MACTPNKGCTGCCSFFCCCCDKYCEVLEDGNDNRQRLLNGVRFYEEEQGGAQREGQKGKGLSGAALYFAVLSNAFREHFQEDEDFRPIRESLSTMDITTAAYQMTKYREKRIAEGLVAPPPPLELPRNEAPVNTAEVRNWLFFAEAAYAESEKTLRDQLATKNHHLVTYSAPMQLFEPAFFISMSTDDTDKTVVLGIKGTSSAVDWLTSLWIAKENLKMRSVPEDECDNDFGVHGGLVHAAKFVLDRVGIILRRGFYDAGFRIVVVGHSLGAGVATVLSLILREDELMDRVFCFAFAPPPAVSMYLAKRSRPYVTSIVNNDDVICRTSVKQLKTLVVNIQKSAEARRRLGNWEAVKAEWDELEWNHLQARAAKEWNESKFDTYIAGRVLFLYRYGEHNRGCVEVPPHSDPLRVTIVSSNMISDHMLDAYRAALENIYFVI